MKIKTIIIDDEPYVRSHIKDLASDLFVNKLEIIGTADSVVSGIKLINETQPDLVLLDVHLGDGTGFDILSAVNNKNINVIFITGFDNNAIKAIKVGALDYILKPIDEDEFIEAIEKAIKLTEKNPNIEKLIEVSQDFFEGVKEKRVILKTSDTVYVVYEKDIIYCKSDGNYTTFYTLKNEKILISKPLKLIEEILSPQVFIRCHQSYIINKSHVLKYNKSGILILNGEYKVPVSSRRKDYTLEKVFN